MDRTDYEHLELLLAKLLKVTDGKKFCIIPFYHNDGSYISTFDEKGVCDNQSIGINLEDAVTKLINPSNQK